MLAAPTRPDPGVPRRGREPARPSRLWRGTLLFVVCTAAGWWFVRDRGTFGDAVRALAAADPRWLAAGIAQAALDVVLGGARMMAAARALGGRVGLGPCMGANTANVFLGGVTPSQSGGGPAQIYILLRGGLSFAQATATSATTFLSTIVVFLVVAIHIAARGTVAEALPLRVAGAATIVIFLLCAAACIVALPRPQSARAFLCWIAARVPSFARHGAFSRALVALETSVGDLHRLLGHAVAHGRSWLAASLILSVLLYANKFVIGWVATRAVGLDLDFASTVHRFEVQALVSYFAPTPGAAGVAELSAGALLADVVPASRLGACLVVWRLCGLYLEMAAGLVVMAAAGLTHRGARTRASIPAPTPRR